MTHEQRDFLRKQIDVRRRQCLADAELSRRGDARLAKAPQRSSAEGEVMTPSRPAFALSALESAEIATPESRKFSSHTASMDATNG